MPTSFTDPDAALDVYCIQIENTAIPTNVARTLPLAKRIDIGLYDYVILVVTSAGGTASGQVRVVPKESDLNTAEFPLDGTNGAPDFTLSFPNAAIGAGNASRQRIIRTAERRRYLNVVVETNIAGGTGTWRPVIQLFGVGKRANTGRLVNTDLSMIGPVA